MTVYIVGAIICALLAGFLLWLYQPAQGKRNDSVWMLHTIDLLRKYVPGLIGGALLGIGIVAAL